MNDASQDDILLFSIIILFDRTFLWTLSSAIGSDMAGETFLCMPVLAPTIVFHFRYILIHFIIISDFVSYLMHGLVICRSLVSTMVNFDNLIFRNVIMMLHLEHLTQFPATHQLMGLKRIKISGLGLATHSNLQKTTIECSEEFQNGPVSFVRRLIFSVCKYQAIYCLKS